MHGHLNVKRWSHIGHSNSRQVSTTLHGVTCQNTWISSNIALRNANLAKFFAYWYGDVICVKNGIGEDCQRHQWNCQLNSEYRISVGNVALKAVESSLNVLLKDTCRIYCLNDVTECGSNILYQIIYCAFHCVRKICLLSTENIYIYFFRTNWKILFIFRKFVWFLRGRIWLRPLVGRLVRRYTLDPRKTVCMPRTCCGIGEYAVGASAVWV